jgi:hypothetical protein
MFNRLLSTLSRQTWTCSHRSAIPALACCLVVTAFPPLPAAAQNYQWQATAFNDETNKGRFTAYLSHGVPETDDRLVTSVCSPGSSARFATTILGYDTSGLPQGRSVRLEITARGRVVYRGPAEVYRNTSDEGLSGLLVRAEVDDPIWDALTRHSAVTYRAGRGPRVPLSLQGSTKAITKFLDDCRGIFGMTARDADNEENNVAAAPSCRRFGKIRSLRSRTPVNVRFHNHTPGQRTVMWIDFNGQPVEYKILAPGESYVQQTYVGHPWMVTDGPGNCKQLFVPQRDTRRFDLTFD